MTLRPIQVVAVAAALLLCGGCEDNLAVAEPEAGPDRPLIARRGDFSQTLLMTGELRAVQATPVTVPNLPSWQAPIRWIEADGARVVKGQRVLELDNSQFTGDLEQKRLAESKTLNELNKTRADVAVKMADLEFAVETARNALNKARLEAEIPPELRPRRQHQEKVLAFEKAKVSHEQAVEALESYKESSVADVAILEIRLRKARREIRTAEQAIESLVLRSPTEGILVIEQNWRENRKFQVGDNAHTGQEVARIPDLSAMMVKARLSDVDDGKLAPAMRARCTLDTYPDEVFEGYVTELAPVAKEVRWQSLRRAFNVDIRLERSDPEKMRPGMSVRVEIDIYSKDNALLVPREALEFDADPPRLGLADGSDVEVRIRACNGSDCAIEGEVEEGLRLRRMGEA